MGSLFKRLWLNKSVINKEACKYVGFTYTLWAFASLFNPLDCVFDATTTFGCKMLFGLITLLVVTLLAVVVAAIVVLCSNRNTVFTTKTNRKVIVQYGDMYSPDVIEKGYQGRRNVVVSVNRCFDTIVDDNVVSCSTQHGRVMKELYQSKMYDEVTLNKVLQQSLNGNQYEELKSADKPEGNLKRYPCGTVAELRISNELTYFFLGLSTYDNHLTASTTKEEYILAFQKLIEFCNARSQGYPVVLHLMGTGLSRANISHEEALNYMISALRINMDIINCDFHIVVWKGMKDKVSIKNI